MSRTEDFEIVQIDDDHWLIHDRRHPSSDARYVVACLTRSGDGVDVVWLDASTALPTRYRDRQDALEELVRWRRRARASTRPVEIPSYPPFRVRRPRRSTGG